jgi:hypothetical protein
VLGRGKGISIDRERLRSTLQKSVGLPMTLSRLTAGLESLGSGNAHV